MAEEKQFGGQGIFLILRISTPGKRISSNQNGHVFMMVGQGKLGTRNREAKLKYKASENFISNIFSIYKKEVDRTPRHPPPTPRNAPGDCFSFYYYNLIGGNYDDTSRVYSSKEVSQVIGPWSEL